MKRLRRFFNLPATDKSLLVKAAFTVAAIRVGLWALPFWILRRLLAWMTRETNVRKEGDTNSVDRTVWAVKVAGRHVPRATCLTQALAAQVLLARRGCPARLSIGVAKSQEGQLEAHAWVESEGRVLIGGLEGLSRYTPLPSLDGEGS